MITLVAVLTARVFTVTVAEVAPAGMVTLAGDRAIVGLLLINFTNRPPAGAGAVSETVAVVLCPPFTNCGCTEIEESVEAVGAPLICKSKDALMSCPQFRNCP